MGWFKREVAALRTLVEYIIALLDLAEAEGRAFRSSLANLVVGLIFLLGGGVLLLTGIWCCLSGVYAGFLHVLNGSVLGAGLITGGITIVLAGVMMWLGKLVTRG